MIKFLIFLKFVLDFVLVFSTCFFIRLFVYLIGGF
jgi:hypothetical protein